MAESEGFEPPDPCGSTVFKTAAIDHSANSPCVGVYYTTFRARVEPFTFLFPDRHAPCVQRQKIRPHAQHGASPSRELYAVADSP